MSKILLSLACFLIINISHAQLFSETFESPLVGWTFQNLSVGGTPAEAAWTIRTSPYNYQGDIFSSNDNSKFIMSNSDAQGPTSTLTHAIMQSPSFSTLGASTVSLNFYHHFSFLDVTDSAVIEVSINGTTWTEVANYNESLAASEGTPVNFQFRTINISAVAANQATVYLRFRHKAVWAFYWLMDNITVTNFGSLPVKLIDFAGQSMNNRNLLSWKTAMEVDNLGFAIERSFDGIKYEQMGFVNSKSADGNSNSQLNYQFTDLNPVGKTQYYRLKQIDQNGDFSYSNIVVLKTPGRTFLSGGIFPNPVISDVNIKVQSAVIERPKLEVFDIGGRLVASKLVQLEQGSNKISLPVQHLKAGTYFIRMVSSGGNILNDKFVKQ
jgi:hypothetical protein